MYDKEIVKSSLLKIEDALNRIIERSQSIHAVNDFLLTPAGMERMESICMLLIAIGESVKRIDKLTDKALLSLYPMIDWKGVMGMRDIIAHHYFDIDADVVFDVIKKEIPPLKDIIQEIIKKI